MRILNTKTLIALPNSFNLCFVTNSLDIKEIFICINIRLLKIHPKAFLNYVLCCLIQAHFPSNNKNIFLLALIFVLLLKLVLLLQIQILNQFLMSCQCILQHSHLLSLNFLSKYLLMTLTCNEYSNTKKHQQTLLSSIHIMEHSLSWYYTESHIEITNLRTYFTSKLAIS